MKSAVLLIVFNRPESTAQVLDALRAAAPPRLYIAADGPRPGRDDDATNCRQVRELALRVDWPCELKTLFRSENLGCKKGVSGAIDWFFEQEAEGIILEDDCVPAPSFFPYCDELLDRFRDDARIAQISGSSFPETPPAEASYFFTKYADIWGWATWRRSWRLADMAMEAWPDWRRSGGLARLPGSTPAFVDYWTRIFDATYAGQVDTWDYQWMFACWHHGLLSVAPACSQITNIGWGAEATHTLSDAPTFIQPARSLPFPLRHNEMVEADEKIERQIARRRYSIGAKSEFGVRLRRIPLVGESAFSLARWCQSKLRGIA